jgi:ATP-dependent protease ClpP protease subunit
MPRPGRANIVSTAETGWPRLLRASLAAVAFVISTIGQGLSASAWEPQLGRLRTAAPDSGNSTVRMIWHGPIAAPMAQQIRDVFEARKHQATRFVLTLSSDGGSVAEGELVIEVLRQIAKTHALETVVSQGEKCASMCVFIYLQGQKRYGALTSSWLFHEVSRRDPATKRTTLDRAAWERLVDKYFRPAGVAEAWIASLMQRTVESDFWQTGADLVQANSGIIHMPLANQKARNVPASPGGEEARSAQPQPASPAECREYVPSVGAVLTVPCSR